VNNVNVTIIHNVYNTTVVNRTVTRVSYNGGNGGISARPRPEEEAAARERHIPAVAAQTQHAQAARTNPEQRASRNHGTPPVAATPKPGALSDREVVRAKPVGTPYNPPANRGAAQPAANAPAERPENGGVRPDRPVQNGQPESKPNRPPAVEPNSRPDRPDANRTPTAQPNNRPEPNRNEPAERPQAPPRSEPSQPQHTPPSAETQRAPQEQQHQQPAARKPEEKKHPDEQQKKDEKPPQ
jgi:hypothetical protein